MVLRFAKLATSCSCVLLAYGLLSSELMADTRVTDDYIALVVEAEDNDSKDERWVLTEPNTPAQEDDPDANHSDQASGNAYLELLPDIRVHHDDPFGPPTGYWGTAGSGPTASYTLTFPEAGRYHAHIRAFSTGLEDNGIHVGINNTWPDSGKRLQFCNGKNTWYWSSNQRDSGGADACGVEKTIWVTVEEAGEHTFMISAREDGFEIDRIMLIKDTSDNTRICSPSGADGIHCRNGSLENVDEVVDLGVELSGGFAAMEIGDSYNFSATVVNHDGYDTAQNAVLTLDIDQGSRWDVTENDAACELQNSDIVCDMGNLPPSGPEDEYLFSFSLTPLISGELSVSASLSTSSIDGDQTNDTAALSTTVADPGTLSQLAVTLDVPSTSLVNGVETTATVRITSVGLADGEDVVLTFTVPDGINLTALPEECSGTQTISCTVGLLAVASDSVLLFGITPERTGLFSSSTTANASNLDGEEVSASRMLTVSEPEPEVVPEPESDEAASFGLWCLLFMSLMLIFRAGRNPIAAVKLQPIAVAARHQRR